MALSTFADRVKVTVASAPGTGPISLGPAVGGFRTFASAGLSDGALVSYVIEDAGSFEVGQGTYGASGPTLARTTIFTSSNGTNPINASAGAVVYLTVTAEDIAAFAKSGGGGGGSSSTQWGSSGPFAPPSAAMFDTVTKHGIPAVTLTDNANRGLVIGVGQSNGNDEVCLIKKAIPSSWGSAWRVRCRLVSAARVSQFPTAGLCVLNLANTHTQAIAYQSRADNNDAGQIVIQQRKDQASFDSNPVADNTQDIPEWFEIELANGNLYYRYSFDGANFFTWVQNPSTGYIGAAPTHIALYFSVFMANSVFGQNGGGVCTFWSDPDNPIAA